MKNTVAQIHSLAEYRHELAIKLWREDKHDEARPLLQEAIEGAETVDKRLGYTNSLSIVERSSGNFVEAIQLINAALPEAVSLGDEHRLAKLHLTQGINYRRLGEATESNEARQNALIHFAGASGFFEKLGDTRHVAIVANNHAHVLIGLNSTGDALYQSERAINLMEGLKDKTPEDEIILLQFLDTRAKARLAANKTWEALGDALKSSAGLHEAQEQHFLKTSLPTLNRCIERLAYEEESEMLENALDKAGGHVKRAADVLGMNHGSFSRLLDKHPELKGKRKAKLKPRGKYCKREQVGVSQ